MATSPATRFSQLNSTKLIPTHLLRESHTLLDLRNRQTRVQPLRTRPRAVHDGVAAVEAHAVVERVLALGGALVAGVGDPAVGLQQHGGAEVFFLVPPVRRARGAAAGAENAFVKAVELLTVGFGLAIFAALRRWVSLGGFLLGARDNRNEWRKAYIWWWGVALEVGLDGSVLLVEVCKIGDEILDDVGVW